jgi:predicted nuclease of restriction endonuclease-like (RecB) superfamily
VGRSRLPTPVPGRSVDQQFREHPTRVAASVAMTVTVSAFAVPRTTVGKLPWGHVYTLLDQVKDPALRDWYADRDARNGWSRPVLEHHVATGLHRRTGAAPSNFDQHLDPIDPDQAQEIVRDPYVFDFLDLIERSTERALEQALTDRLQDTLAELGPGFAFVGRQHPFTVENQDFHVDCSEVVAVADGELVLAADEGEAGSEFGQEVGQPGDEGFFEVPLVVVGVEGEEVQVVGVLQDFPGLVRFRWCQDVGEVVGCGADAEMPPGLDVVFQDGRDQPWWASWLTYQSLTGWSSILSIRTMMWPQGSFAASCCKTGFGQAAAKLRM